MGYDKADPFRSCRRFVVLPYSDHRPTRGLQQPIRLGVPRLIPCNFLRPVPTIYRVFSAAVNRAPVPEATIEEHGDAGGPEDYVGPAPQPGLTERWWRAIHPVAEALLVEHAPDGELGLSVPAALELHPAPDARADGVGAAAPRYGWRPSRVREARTAAWRQRWGRRILLACGLGQGSSTRVANQASKLVSRPVAM